MALIEYTLDGKIDKVEKAINRIRTFDPSKSEHMQNLAPYYVAYSGGKDSDVIRILFSLSGVKHELVHNHTTVDAPETVRYVRSIPGIRISYPEMTMWDLIVKKRMPPTRIVRYCCEHLKERGGTGRFVATGVRWAESVKRRKNRGSVEALTTNVKNKLILNADNDESRYMLESCVKKAKYILNPIVDWSDGDVWEFLRHYGCKSNPLYECGYRRVGCIGCPMSRSARQLAEFRRYPKYKDAYLRAFDRMLTERRKAGLPANQWRTGEDVFAWWTGNASKSAGTDDMQISLWDEAQEW